MSVISGVEILTKWPFLVPWVKLYYFGSFFRTERSYPLFRIILHSAEIPGMPEIPYKYSKSMCPHNEWIRFLSFPVLLSNLCLTYFPQSPLYHPPESLLALRCDKDLKTALPCPLQCPGPVKPFPASCPGPVKPFPLLQPHPDLWQCPYTSHKALYCPRNPWICIHANCLLYSVILPSSASAPALSSTGIKNSCPLCAFENLLHKPLIFVQRDVRVYIIFPVNCQLDL